MVVYVTLDLIAYASEQWRNDKSPGMTGLDR